MSRTNPPLLAWNRGLISPKALARVDLDRVRLSAERFENWIPSTQGSMSIRPGTEHYGSSLRDTGAYWVEFVAAADDVALIEMTGGVTRFWLGGDDAHDVAMLERPPVDTTVSLSDTGWDDASTGGNAASGATSNIIPIMTGPTTSGVTITSSSDWESGPFGETHPDWIAADGLLTTYWQDTGNDSASSLPTWWNVDFGSGNAKTVRSYSIRSGHVANLVDNAPSSWRLIGSNFDTGTFATDTGKWVLEDERSAQTGWAVSQNRSFTLSDTGAPDAWRHWRLYFTALDGDTELVVSEIEMFSVSSSQATFANGSLTLNATSIGARAKATKRVIVSDTGTEHALAIQVERGPITLRVGSTNGDDDYISETSIGTGYHNLAFTPLGDFWITLQSDQVLDRIVSSMAIADSGTVEVTSPWGADNLDDIRHDQSADVVFADCRGIRQQMIERRGTGRSWSVVDYAPDDGPFLPTRSSSAKFSVSHFFGNTTLNSDIPFFTAEHVGALVRIFHEGQGGQWRLGNRDAETDAIAVTGIADTGTPGDNSERRIVFAVSGTYTGRVAILRSMDGPDLGFKPISTSGTVATTASDTGTFTKSVDDPDDNLKVWYKARITDTGSTLDTGVGAGGYTSGVAVVNVTYPGGGVTGIARITSYNSNTSVGIEVLSRFSDTGPADNWQQGYWSDARGFPTAVALHGGRLAHAQGGSVFLSVADDYESFDEDTIGDAGPVIRTLGSGPVDSIHTLLSLLRLIIHTSGAELTLRSSSLDEPVTPTNSSAGTFSTQGTAPLRAIKLDNRGIFVQRSRKRVFMVGPDTQAAVGDYGSSELTLLVPDLLAPGVVSIAVQRQPDTRIHVALADGRVAILTYEPAEEVICWTTWSTAGFVERVMVLPGVDEDAVYYHIRRMIGSGNDEFTKVLLHFDGDDESTTFGDSNVGGGSHTWLPAGDAQVDTGESKFGGASGLFDGTGDYISTPDSADFTLGSSDFTIDLWFNCTAASGTIRGLAGQDDNAATDVAWSLLRNTDGTIVFRCTEDGDFTPSTTLSSTSTFTDAVNTGWHHLAISRVGTSLMMFIDGLLEDAETMSFASIQASSRALTVGSYNDVGAAPWLGWIDEFRLSIGIARWTANFTPPTTPYGSVRRFLEKWAMESQCQGDTGFSGLLDCSVNYTDTGRTFILDEVAPHLAGENVIVWGSLDTGSTPHVDLSPDTGSDFSQRLWAVGVDGTVTLTGLTEGVHHASVGLPYSATWVSGKMAYGAQMGTALGQAQRLPQTAVIAYRLHARALFLGTDTGGTLDPIPRVIDGATVDPDHIFPTLDKLAFPIPATWQTDPRMVVKSKAPRPATLLALVPTVVTNER